MNTLSLARNVAVDRVSNAVAAGTSDVNCTSVDMEGFETATFVVSFGTITSTAVTSIQIDHSSDNSNWNTVAGSKVTIPDSASNKVAITETVRPTLRYVRCTIDRGTANAVIDGVVAIRSDARKAPVTQGATVQGTTVIVGSTTGTP
jgi:hypothetical protein